MWPDSKNVWKKILNKLKMFGWKMENGNKKYLCGDKISVADIVALCELEQPSIAG